MNFFEHQEKARRQTRWLVFLFALAVLTIVVVIDLVLLVVLGGSEMQAGQSVFSAAALQNNQSTLAGGAILTVTVVALASLFKTVSLRSGGGKVARDLGAVLVEADARDPLRRRLYNVVEEIALASGVTVPEVYVLEQESGINAFAAGFTPADAAVAVTRGALEKLNRSELQGVIAHEFSHIFNGDMRLNIRLMGALFGILVLSLIGRRVLHGSYFMGRSRSNNGGVILVLAFAVMVVGYIGLFFGRWIKAAVSRQREYLADASAVQFTRDPNGIGGALKKIAVYSDGSHLNVETEEVSHMLFGNGEKTSMFATHPALNDRIKRVEPSFTPDDLQALAEKIKHQNRSQAEKAARELAEEGKKQGARNMFDAGNLVDQIGSPDFSRIMMAAALAASIPPDISNAAHSNQWSTEILFYCLMDPDAEIRERQLMMVLEIMGSESESRLRGLLRAERNLERQQRLPLLEISIPELKRRPPDHVHKVLKTVKALSEADGRIGVFEYLMGKVISQHLWEAANPQQVKMSGNKSLAQVRKEALGVIAVLAAKGNQGEQAVAAAFEAGRKVLGSKAGNDVPEIEDWTGVLDRALPLLDKLKPMDKEKFVNGMIAAVMADERVAVSELELLRVICTLVHVPLPMLTGGESV